MCLRVTSRRGLQAVSRAGRQYQAARRMSAAPTVSTVTPGGLQAFSRAKGKYPPLAVAWYLFLVHIARWYPSLAGPSRRFSESNASKRATAVPRAAWSRQGLFGAAARRALSIL